MGTSFSISFGFTTSPWGQNAGRLIDAGRGSVSPSRRTPLRSGGGEGGVGGRVDVLEGAGVPGEVEVWEGEGEREIAVGEPSLSVAEGEVTESAAEAAASW